MWISVPSYTTLNMTFEANGTVNTTPVWTTSPPTSSVTYVLLHDTSVNAIMTTNVTTGFVGIGTTTPTEKLHVVGNVLVNGALSKSSGTFDIEHPLLDGKRLIHSFIEGPRCDLIYRGKRKLQGGHAMIDIDLECVHEEDCAMTKGTFEALCTNPMVYLQNNETFDRVKGFIEGTILHIASENASSTASINWLIIAERKDTFMRNWERTNTNGFLRTEY